MRRSIIDHTHRSRRGARLPRFAAMDRRPEGGLTPLFENLFRRARTRDAKAKLTHYLAIARKT
ncbi:MAG: hypothetical protein QNJ13_12045 [Paracoccaceae bacterium]|nr:hypothetical protein [Paracoccaceae bacterium]